MKNRDRLIEFFQNRADDHKPNNRYDTDTDPRQTGMHEGYTFVVELLQQKVSYDVTLNILKSAHWMVDSMDVPRDAGRRHAINDAIGVIVLVEEPNA